LVQRLLPPDRFQDLVVWCAPFIILPRAPASQVWHSVLELHRAAGRSLGQTFDQSVGPYEHLRARECVPKCAGSCATVLAHSDLVDALSAHFQADIILADRNAASNILGNCESFRLRP